VLVVCVFFCLQQAAMEGLSYTCDLLHGLAGNNLAGFLILPFACFAIMFFILHSKHVSYTLIFAVSALILSLFLGRVARTIHTRCFWQGNMRFYAVYTCSSGQFYIWDRSRKMLREANSPGGRKKQFRGRHKHACVHTLHTLSTHPYTLVTCIHTQSLATRVEKLRRANSGSGTGGAGGSETERELSEEVKAVHLRACVCARMCVYVCA